MSKQVETTEEMHEYLENVSEPLIERLILISGNKYRFGSTEGFLINEIMETYVALYDRHFILDVEHFVENGIQARIDFILEEENTAFLQEAFTQALHEADVVNVADFSYMFYGLEKVQDLDLSTFDTSNARYMSYMFANMNNLESLDITNFSGDVTRVNASQNQFTGLASLREMFINKANFQLTTPADTWENVNGNHWVKSE